MQNMQNMQNMQTIKKPDLNNILNKLKLKIPIPQDGKTKYDVLTSENRIHVSDTIDSIDSSSINNSNIKKVKKNRIKIK